MSLTFEDDEFVRDLPRWVVDLDNGQSVYEDDGRPGTEGSAWPRLGAYCREHGLSIAAMRLQFRSHVVHLPPGMDGYYFAKSSLGVWGEPESYAGFVAGYVANNQLLVRNFKVPELEPLGEPELRIIDSSKESLIQHKSLR